MKTMTAFLRSLRTWPRLRVMACALALVWMGNAIGDQPWQALHGEVGRGDVVPLETILDWLEERYIGDILEIEIDRDDGLVEYEIKMLGPQGQVVEFEFDGHSGQLMKIEGVRIREMQRNP
ncbi:MULTISPECIES: PepSY domain-containing protein [Halomonadaceae]|uniref:PepSY domain-containing protein n=1 Tax=Halomonadaceae TaxID=28256 RepID=UPI0011A54634